MADKLLVPREQFRSALRALKRQHTGTKPREAVVSSRNGLLRIELESASCDLEVEGGWIGRALVPARALLGLASRLPKDDPIEIWIHEGILHVGSLWMKLAPDALPPPLTDMEQAGLDIATIRKFHEVLQAERPMKWYQRRIPIGTHDAESRVMRLTEAAAAILAPLGVSEHDVRVLVTRRIRALGPRIR